MEKLSSKQKTTFFYQLASTLNSGFPLLSSIAAATASMPNSFRKKLESSLQKGDPLSKALLDSGYRFERSEIGLIQAGEKAGFLDRSAQILADSSQQAWEDQKSLFSVMTYPIVIIHFASFLLPLKLLVTESLSSYFIGVLWVLGPVYLISLFTLLLLGLVLRVPPLRALAEKIGYNIPVIGTTFREQHLYQFFTILSSCLETGISTNNSLELAALSCDSLTLSQNIIAQSKQKAQIPLSQILEKAPLLNSFDRMQIKTAEENGEVPKTTQSLAQSHKNDYERSKKTFFILFPILLFLPIAGFIGFKVITEVQSIYQPVFDMMP